MSFVEIAIAVSSAAAGVAAGSFTVYISGRKPRPDNSNYGIDGKSQKISTTQKSISIPKERLEKSKRELRTLVLEKELVSAALTRLYEAEVAREITRDEREVLGSKYKGELKTLDEKISKIDAFIQIGDLETLRSQLLQLVDQKMGAIEKRIENTKLIAEPLIAEMLNRGVAIPTQRAGEKASEEKPKVPDISDLLQKPETPFVAARGDTNSPEHSLVVQSKIEQPQIVPTAQQNFASRKSGEKVEELQKELLEALDRLEKLDIET